MCLPDMLWTAWYICISINCIETSITAQGYPVQVLQPSVAITASRARPGCLLPPQTPFLATLSFNRNLLQISADVHRNSYLYDGFSLGGDDSAMGVSLRHQMFTNNFDYSTLDSGTTLIKMRSLVPDISAYPNQTWNNHNHLGSSESPWDPLHLSKLSLNKPKQTMIFSWQANISPLYPPAILKPSTSAFSYWYQY